MQNVSNLFQISYDGLKILRNSYENDPACSFPTVFPRVFAGGKLHGYSIITSITNKPQKSNKIRRFAAAFAVGLAPKGKLDYNQGRVRRFLNGPSRRAAAGCCGPQRAGSVCHAVRLFKLRAAPAGGADRDPQSERLYRQGGAVLHRRVFGDGLCARIYAVLSLLIYKNVSYPWE